MIPDGLRVEPWSERNDEEFRSVRNESFQDHWGTAPMPVDAWRSNVTNQTFQPEAGFLLREVTTGTPVGMLVTKCWEADTAATGIRDANFFLMRTLREHRNRGEARALVGHALRAAADQGYGRVSVRVDSAGAAEAVGVYEEAGFRSKLRLVRWALEG